MSTVVSFKKAKAKQLKQKSSLLCANGHHQWQVCKAKQFDVKLGKLVTVYLCKRCKKQKVESH